MYAIDYTTAAMPKLPPATTYTRCQLCNSVELWADMFDATIVDDIHYEPDQVLTICAGCLQEHYQPISIG